MYCAQSFASAQESQAEPYCPGTSVMCSAVLNTPLFSHTGPLVGLDFFFFVCMVPGVTNVVAVVLHCIGYSYYQCIDLLSRTCILAPDSLITCRYMQLYMYFRPHRQKIDAWSHARAQVDLDAAELWLCSHRHACMHELRLCPHLHAWSCTGSAIARAPTRLLRACTVEPFSTHSRDCPSLGQ